MKISKLLKLVQKKVFNLKPLDEHKRIGLDLDGTFAFGVHSKEIREYVKHSKQQFHIITFRSELPKDMYKDLMKYKNIVSVQCRPPEIIEFSKEFCEWKGKVCKKLGCTALIDDDIAAVINGCLEYDVQLFNTYKWHEYKK